MRYLICCMIAFATACGSCATTEAVPQPQLTAATPAVEAPEPEGKVHLPIDWKPGAGHRVARIIFNEDVSAASAGELIAWIHGAVPARMEALVLDLYTAGGSVGPGIAISHAIENSPVPIYCVADGLVASMGFFILQSCKYRLMTMRTSLMVHEPSVGVSGPRLALRNAEAFVDSQTISLSEQECGRLKISKKACREHFSGGKEWWINWHEALDVGAVDGVVLNAITVTEGLRWNMKIPGPPIHMGRDEFGVPVLKSP